MNVVTILPLRSRIQGLHLWASLVLALLVIIALLLESPPVGQAKGDSGVILLPTQSNHGSAVLTSTLIVGTNPDYWPMEYMSGTQVVGHDMELMTFVGDRLGAQVEYSIIPDWNQIFQGVMAGEHDLVISSVSITPWRDQWIDYTLPYVTFAGNDNVAMVVQQGNDALRRQLNEALLHLRTDGTLASIVADIAADRPEWQPTLPTWPHIAPDVATTVVYTYPDQCPTLVQVPPGAVTGTVLLAFSGIPTITAPAGLAFAGKAFELEAYRDGVFAAGFVFSSPVTVTVHYSGTDLVGLAETTLGLYYWDGDAGVWADARSTCEASSSQIHELAENWLAVPVCHLSRFALLARPDRVFVYLPLLMRDVHP